MCVFLKKDQPDGFITPTEFETIFKKFYPYGNPKKYAKIAFKAFDADKSGKISFSEFLIATSFVNSSDVAKTIDFAFDVYDSDNNGKVDKKEMLDMVTAIYEIENIDLAAAKNTVEEVFKEYDKDNSNSLNKQEFIKFFLSDPIIQRTFY